MSKSIYQNATGNAVISGLSTPHSPYHTGKNAFVYLLGL